MGPSIFEFHDYRAFLAAWVDHQKQEQASFSFATFAVSAGCSRSALPNVLARARHPRPATLDAFARGMDLTPRERNYLGLLVELAAAPDLTARRIVMERILATESFDKRRVAEAQEDADVFRFLEHWYVPAVFELAGIEGFREDPRWIARTLCPAITPEQAADALHRLLDLGYLGRTPEGRICKGTVRFQTATEAIQEGVAHFHRTQLPRLMHAIRRQGGDARHVLANTLCLDVAMLPEVKELMNALQITIAAQADAPASSEGRCVYQFAMQLLPVSQVLAADDH